MSTHRNAGALAWCSAGKLILGLALVSFLPVIPANIDAQVPKPDGPVIEEQVEKLLAKLSLDEKIDLIGGFDDMCIRPLPSINLPRLKMSDGPVGVRTWGPATALPAGIGLAASWDPELARRAGVVLGQDSRARGVHFLLGPGVNIYRSPMNGRNFEYFGEDPYLAGRIVVGYVTGVQSQGVVATVKHFALNNSEFDRHNTSSDTDERTIREIYLPPFEAAVRDAHAGAVMDSYNLINGVHATQNDWLNNQVLKKDWRFDGILMSDWGSTYDGVAAANSGLDLEMPRGEFMNRTTLVPAVQKGRVSLATIDDKVRRILRTAIRFGFFDRPQEDLSIPRYNPYGSAIALDEARESIVLLKNENKTLPLHAKQVRTIALLGPDLWPIVTGAGGSSTVTPFRAISLLEALTHSENLKVLYDRGIPSIRELLDGTTFEEEVTVQSFPSDTFTGTPITLKQSRIDDWKAGDWVPPGQPQSFRYTGTYLPRKSGKYLIVAVAAGEDSYTVLLNSKPILQQPRREGQTPLSTEIQLNAGQPLLVQVDYVVRAAKPRVGLGIRPVDELVSDVAKKLAASADATVISVGFDPWSESEGYDRTYALPFGQEELIQSISALNKRSIVVLTSGGEVDTAHWLNDVPVLLHNWYPGQEGGTALADILLGVRSPEGKLPISFAKSWEQNPVHDHYYPLAAPEQGISHVRYAEGVFLGYRYYTSGSERPLFPFGFGLSYTSFEFSNLRISHSSSSDKQIRVSCDVTNIGKMAGADVVQVYVSDPSAKVKRPERELKAFQKVRLQPGERTRITLLLDERAFSYWDEVTHAWRVDPGLFRLYVGDSSENTPLTAELMLAN